MSFNFLHAGIALAMFLFGYWTGIRGYRLRGGE